MDQGGFYTPAWVAPCIFIALWAFKGVFPDRYDDPFYRNDDQGMILPSNARKDDQAVSNDVNRRGRHYFSIKT